jgi:tetratricopeptide (TPR) repeat protein
MRTVAFLAMIALLALPVPVDGEENTYKVWGREYDTVYFVFLKYLPKGSNEMTNLFDKDGAPRSTRFHFCQEITKRKELSALNAILNDKGNFEENEVECSFVMYGFAFYKEGRLVMALVPDVYALNLGSYPWRQSDPPGWSQRGIDRLNRLCMEFIAYPRCDWKEKLPRASTADLVVSAGDDDESYGYDEARESLEEAKSAIEEIQKKVGPDHLDLVPLLLALANVYEVEDVFDYQLAEGPRIRALEILEKNSGVDHPDLLPIIIKLAVSYAFFRPPQLAKAEILWKRALAIQEKTLTAEHLDIAWTLEGLADCYKSQDKLSLAIPLRERALKIRETNLGVDHPDLAWYLERLAGLYYWADRKSEAKALDARAGDLRKRADRAEQTE